MKTKHGNKWFSKLIALCLAVVMTLSMSMTVFAEITADTNKGSINISGLTTDEGTTVTAYKVIDVKFNYEEQQPEEPVYTWTAEMAAYLTGAGNTAYGKYIDTDNSNAVTKAYFDATAADLSAFYADVIKDAGLTTVAGTADINADGTASISDLVMGQYLLKAEPADGKQTEYRPVVANVFPVYDDTNGWTVSSADVVLKGSAPGIDKEIDADGAGETDKTVAVGDTVPYKVTVDIPSYPDDAKYTDFVIGDNLSAGLTLDVDSITVATEDGESLAENTYYKKEADERHFKLTLTEFYEKIKNDFPDADKLVVKYTATVNENAFKPDALGNKAYIGYTNDPYKEGGYTEIPDEEEVFTYGITMIKTVETGDSAEGAVFELRDSENGNPLSFVHENGVYRLAKAGETGVTELEVQKINNGWGLQLTGLDVGTYYLRETEAPDGYVLPDADIVITLADSQPDGTLDGSDVTYTSSAVNKAEVKVSETQNTVNVLEFSFSNVPYDKDGNFHLPTTGGMGTMIFTIAGILLMGGAAVLVVMAARRKRG